MSIDLKYDTDTGALRIQHNRYRLVILNGVTPEDLVSLGDQAHARAVELIDVGEDEAEGGT